MLILFLLDCRARTVARSHLSDSGKYLEILMSQILQPKEKIQGGHLPILVSLGKSGEGKNFERDWSLSHPWWRTRRIVICWRIYGFDVSRLWLKALSNYAACSLVHFWMKEWFLFFLSFFWNLIKFLSFFLFLKVRCVHLFFVTLVRKILGRSIF